MVSLKQFGRNMDRSGKNLPSSVNVVVKAVGRAVGHAVVDDTPVDQGQARSNWLPSLGVPIKGTIAPYQEYPKGSRGLGQGRRETANASAAKARIDGAINARQPGQSIIIQNNLDYIRELNAGSSAQAPALFVQSAIRAGIVALNGAVIRV